MSFVVTTSANRLGRRRETCTGAISETDISGEGHEVLRPRKEIGGYLTKLEDDFGLIGKNQPLFEKTAQKSVRYRLNDNFLIFWFRFIHRFSYMVEIAAFAQLRDIIRRDYETFSGRALESYFRETLIESGKYTRISGWWDRKGENEIDLVCENELTGALDFYEVKCDAARLDLPALQLKVAAFFRKHPDKMRVGYGVHGLSVEDM